MTNAKILAAAGLVAALCGFVGGYLTPWFPRLGPILLGSGSGIMLLGNAIVLLRKERA